MKKFAKILSFLATTLVAIVAYAGDITVNSIEGDDVTVAGAPTAPGAVIQPGQIVKTGEKSKVVVKLPDGSTITVDENSEIQFTGLEETEDGKIKRVSLKVTAGAVSVAMSLPRGSSVTIQTPQGTVSGRSGTVYVSTAGGATTVTATGGSVKVTNSADNSTATVGSGQSSTIGSDTGTTVHVATAAEIAAANALAGVAAEPTPEPNATSPLTGDVHIEGLDIDTQILVEGETEASVNSPEIN